MQMTGNDVRRNFLCLVWMGSVFSMGWAEINAVLQPVLVYFGASNFQIGLTQGVLVFMLPGMVASQWITRYFTRKKWYVFIADSLYLLPIAGVGVLVLGVGAMPAQQVVVLMIVLMGFSQLAAGFGGLPNQEFFASCIPMRWRGRLAGVSSGIGGGLGIVGAAFAAWWLGRVPEPFGYGVLLIMGWFLCQLADSAVLLAREPPTPVEESPPAWSASMWRAFFRDRLFVRVVLAVCLVSPFMGVLMVFSSAMAFRELSFTPEMAGWIAMSAAVARMLFSPLAGWATDRLGARNTLLAWPLMSVPAFLLLAFFPSVGSVLLAVAVASVAWSGFSGSMNALTAGLPVPEHRAGHFSLLAFCMVGVNSVGPVFTGGIMDRLGYQSGFATLALLLCVVCIIAALLIRPLSSHFQDYH